MTGDHHEGSEIRSWIVIGLILAGILLKGVFTYGVVGDRGQPDWAYRPVADVPGESPYALYPKLPHSQHIQGREGK